MAGYNLQMKSIERPSNGQVAILLLIVCLGTTGTKDSVFDYDTLFFTHNARRCPRSHGICDTLPSSQDIRLPENLRYLEQIHAWAPWR
jgi:hypothetical protein